MESDRNERTISTGPDSIKPSLGFIGRNAGARGGMAEIRVSDHTGSEDALNAPVVFELLRPRKGATRRPAGGCLGMLGSGGLPDGSWGGQRH